MQIKVAKKDLEDALRVTNIALAGSGEDLSGHHLVRIREGRVEMLSYDAQRVCALTPLVCQFEGDEGDALTLHGWRLSKWLLGIKDVAILIEKLVGEVKLTGGRSTVRFKTLDPNKFPFWDKTQAEAELSASVEAGRLLSALAYARGFVGDKVETTHPELAQVEVMGGTIWATDRRAITLVTLAEMSGSKARVHAKDVPAVQKFLSLPGMGVVAMREHDRQVFFFRNDGALLGVSRPLTAFPSLKVDRDSEPDALWELNTEDLLTAITCLSASAEKNNTRVRFAHRDKQVVVSVESSAGGRDEYPLDPVTLLNPDKVPDEGFDVDFPYIEHVVRCFKGETLKMGITLSPKGRGGYIRFANGVPHDSNVPDGPQDQYLSVVVWRL